MSRTGLKARTGLAIAGVLLALGLACQGRKSKTESAGSKASAESEQSAASKGPSASTETPRAGGDAGLRFRTVSCVDKEGTGTEVFRMLAPSDWTFSGGVRWLMDNPGMPAVVSFRVTGPGAAEELEVFPNQMFFWTTNQMMLTMFPVGSRYFGSEVRPPVGALEALREIVVPRFRGEVAGLRVVRAEPLPDLARQLGASAQAPPGGTASAEGARLRIQYTRDGRATEEEIYGVVETSSFPIQSMTGTQMNTIWLADYLFSFKAPSGALDSHAKLFQTIATSFRLNPRWFSQYQQVSNYLIQNQIQQIRNVGELSRIISRTSNEISDMMMESYNERQAVYDRISTNFSQTIRGVDEYYDPLAERPVELPSGYDNAWSNSLGEYIVSEDPGYNPNVGSNLNWERMQRKSP